jgi:ABC-type antimicrobial peptide transport system permease subunit
MLSQKVAESMLGSMGLIALVLAAVGLYSVMAYSVSRRTQEIGIRMALGARTGEVLVDVLKRGMALTAAGLAAGIVVALAATRVVAGMLVQLSAMDPLVFGGAAVFLVLVALAACYLPARRAARVDPMTALRCE